MNLNESLTNFSNLEGFHEQTREANDCLFGFLIKIRKLRQKLLCQRQLRNRYYMASDTDSCFNSEPITNLLYNCIYTLSNHDTNGKKENTSLQTVTLPSAAVICVRCPQFADPKTMPKLHH
jgi:hypothetical protein